MFLMCIHFISMLVGTWHVINGAIIYENHVVLLKLLYTSSLKLFTTRLTIIRHTRLASFSLKAINMPWCRWLCIGISNEVGMTCGIYSKGHIRYLFKVQIGEYNKARSGYVACWEPTRVIYSGVCDNPINFFLLILLIWWLMLLLDGEIVWECGSSLATIQIWVKTKLIGITSRKLVPNVKFKCVVTSDIHILGNIA